MDFRFGGNVKKEVALELGLSGFYAVEDDKEFPAAPQIQELAGDPTSFPGIVTSGDVRRCIGVVRRVLESDDMPRSRGKLPPS